MSLLDTVRRTPTRILAIGGALALATNCLPGDEPGDVATESSQQGVPAPDAERHTVEFVDSQPGRAALNGAGAALARDLPRSAQPRTASRRSRSTGCASHQVHEAGTSTGSNITRVDF